MFEIKFIFLRSQSYIATNSQFVWIKISRDQKRLFLRTLPLMDTSARCCQSGISFWIKFFFFKCRIFLAYVTHEIPLGSLKKSITFGPSIWPAIADIYIWAKSFIIKKIFTWSLQSIHHKIELYLLTQAVHYLLNKMIILKFYFLVSFKR